MPQRVLFAGLPGTAPLAWVSTLVPFLAELERSRPGPKGVKEWLRARNLFDVGTWEVLMEMLEVRLEDPVVLGRTAQDLLRAPDDAAARAVLARRLVEENPLLARYCLQALDTEHEGRLHSTNELFRMITSYVYPGQKPTLVSFKAWVDWAVAGNLLRMVGIRWALAEGAREVLPRLRALDPEEWLEEEGRLGDQDGVGPDPDPGEEVSAREVASPVATTGPLPAGGAVSEQAAEQAEAPVGAPISPAPLPRTSFLRPASMPPVAFPAPVVAAEVAVPLSPVPLDLDATRRMLLESRERDPGRPGPLATRIGATDPLEAAWGALLLARRLSPVEIRQGLEALRGTEVFREAAAGTLTLAALASAEAATASAPVRRVLVHLPALPRLQAGLRDPNILQGEDPAEWLDRAWKRFYAPDDHLAPFWLARILGGLGRLPDSLWPATVVPHYQLRENAFRIGFLPRLHATSFPDLVEAALRLAEGFPPDPAEHLLERVHETHGCAFRCPRALLCPLSCRERLEVAPGSLGP